MYLRILQKLPLAPEDQRGPGEEVAEAVLLLATNSYITGQTIKAMCLVSASVIGIPPRLTR
jgi:NAD(P)-dependent dehydrogenase (short-subunit alcohol dehydrogenase family)